MVFHKNMAFHKNCLKNNFVQKTVFGYKINKKVKRFKMYANKWIYIHITSAYAAKNLVLKIVHII